MSRVLARLAGCLAAAAATTAVVAAQQPRIGNARLIARDAAAFRPAFDAAVASQTDAGWVGYAVPMVDADRTMCCGHADGAGTACCAVCALEPSEAPAAATRGSGPPSAAREPIKLERANQLVVLVRVVRAQVERLRFFSDDCTLDAGGRDVVWLTAVRPAESVGMLESLAAGRLERRDRLLDGTVAAIALHADSAADGALERLLEPGQPEALRAKIPFWLGNARGSQGLAVLQRLIRDDPSREVRKKAVFGISQSREPRATDILIDQARSNPDSTVRAESIFWLAQKAGARAANAITERIAQDPDTEVKKRAVFALSQLPKDEGLPRLIHVARTHSNPAVKKHAMFWLGQSKDPRALDFFAEILK